MLDLSFFLSHVTTSAVSSAITHDLTTKISTEVLLPAFHFYFFHLLIPTLLRNVVVRMTYEEKFEEVAWLRKNGGNTKHKKERKRKTNRKEKQETVDSRDRGRC